MRLSRVLILAALALGGCSSSGPRVLLATDAGDITVELDPKRAPVSAGNFLRYVDEGRFAGATFYRVVRPDNQPQSPVKIEVIQGGLGDDKAGQALPAIAHETTDASGLRHRDGTVSMARREPGTAASEFFICVGDQPELDFGGKRNPDGQGFAAFGKVISGMDVVRRIQALPDTSQRLTAPVAIRSVTRK